MIKLLNQIRLWYRKRYYRKGQTITNFIARDIRRDVEIIDVSKIEEGVLLVRMRTWNVLYYSYGIDAMPDFGEERYIQIDEMWNWTGAPWGGPVPKDDPFPEARLPKQL